MAQRDVFQHGFLDALERMAMADLGLLDDDEPEEDLEFSGCWFGARNALVTWQDWREHGNYPRPGGSLDQPARWHDDKDTLTAWYNYFIRKHKDDKRDG